MCIRDSLFHHGKGVRFALHTRRPRLQPKWCAIAARWRCRRKRARRTHVRELAILGQVRVQVLLPGKQDALISPRFHRRRTRGALRTYPPRFGRCLRRRRRRHPAGSQRRRTAPVARVGESRFKWRCVPMHEGRGVYIHVTATRPGRATPAPVLVSLRSCPPAAPPDDAGSEWRVEQLC